MPLSQDKTTEIQKQYDPLRKKAQQQEAANFQGQKDALERRAAQLNGGPSGALIKQESIAQDAMARRLADANEGINAQQQAAILQAQQVQEQRDWQSGESAMDRKLQRYGIDVNKALGEGQLTGYYGGKATLAKVQGDSANTLAEAGLTGVYKGGQTLAAKSQTALEKQNAIENEHQVKNNILTQLYNLKDAGYNPDEINTILKNLDLGNLLGMDPIDIGIIPGVNERRPMVAPKSSGFGAQAQAVEENRRNGYTVKEMQEAGIIGDNWR